MRIKPCVRMLRMAIAVLFALMCLGSAALADKAVYLDYYTGDDARICFEMGRANRVLFNGQEYTLENGSCAFQQEFRMYGGNTEDLHEMSVPMLQQHRFANGSDAKLGRIIINPPSTMTLYVFSGDRNTGMYMMRDPIELSSAYQEDVYATHDSNGRLQKIDRVYLYQYEENGQIQYKAMSMYIDYENYDASPAENSQSANSAADSVDDSTREESQAQMEEMRAEYNKMMDAALANQQPQKQPDAQEPQQGANQQDAAQQDASQQNSAQPDATQTVTVQEPSGQLDKTHRDTGRQGEAKQDITYEGEVHQNSPQQEAAQQNPTEEQLNNEETPAMQPDTMVIHAQTVQIEQNAANTTADSAADNSSSDNSGAQNSVAAAMAVPQRDDAGSTAKAFPLQWAGIGIGALALALLAVLVILLLRRNKKAKADDTATRQRFYRLTEIDQQQKNAKPVTYNNDVTLEGICRQFRDYAASELHLYYSLDMIRTFIASFAASRLIIMQGISGTGKTSLAYAFGKFVENNSTVIPVQPSWRDRSDLLGYFNEFTKRFNETELLSTIYEAGYNDDVYIAVLDEMNIARVEYYFAEFLSILEMPSPEEWVVNIVPDHWELDPKNLQGGKLHLPSNMWYIGTANNDDSTFAISDKVYDRAMILDIDSRAERFTAPPTQSLKLSAQTFEKMLKEAASRYHISDENLEKINQLDAYIIQHLRVAFGNRIMNQFYRFVPAYMACGGEEVSGIDYILCKKVLRKFENQNMAYIRDEIDDLCDYLDELFGRDTMRVSLEYLRRLKKMG